MEDLRTYQDYAAEYPMKADPKKDFKLSADGKTLSKIKKTFSGPLVVPEGVEVVEFEDNQSYSRLSALILPDSVKEIVGKPRWSASSNFDVIRLSPNLKLTDRLFEGLRAEWVSIPEGIEVIPVRAFADSKIAEVKLPSTLKFVCSGAFADSYLEEVTIPANVKVIFTRAFDTVDKVEFEGPDTVVFPQAFLNIEFPERALKDQTYGHGEERYEGDDLVYLPPYYCCSLVIKDGTKKVINLGEFDGITELTYPASVEYVGLPAYLHKLTAPDTETYLDLMGQEYLTEFNVPSALKKIKISYAPIKELTLPEGLTDAEIVNMSELEVLNLPSTIQNVEISRCPKLPNQ